MSGDYATIVSEVRRRSPVYAFTGEFLGKLRTAAAHEPRIRIEEFSPPKRLPQFVTPVVAVATWRAA